MLRGLIDCESDQFRPSRESPKAKRSNPVLYILWRDRIRRQLVNGLSIEQFCAFKNSVPGRHL